MPGFQVADRRQPPWLVYDEGLEEGPSLFATSRRLAGCGNTVVAGLISSSGGGE